MVVDRRNEVGLTAVIGGLATPVHLCEGTQYNDIIMVVDRRNEVQCLHTPCRYTSPRLCRNTV